MTPANLCIHSVLAHAPCVEVFECVMSVSQMLVQGMWGKGTSPILQLPHVKPDQLKHFKTRKVSDMYSPLTIF